MRVVNETERLEVPDGRHGARGIEGVDSLGGARLGGFLLHDQIRPLPAVGRPGLLHRGMVGDGEQPEEENLLARKIGAEGALDAGVQGHGDEA